MPEAALSESARSWVKQQTDKLVGIGWSLRCAAACTISALSFGLSRTGSSDWEGYVVPLLGYGVLSGVISLLSRHRTTLAFAPLAVVLDVAVITFVQANTMHASPHPAGVAGFSLGLFCLLIAVNGLSMRGAITWATALFASFGQMWLMQEAGVGFGAQAVAAVVLGVNAAAVERLAVRLLQLADTWSKLEVEKQMQERRFAENETARRTIEHMLDEARDRNQRLQLLQKEKDVLTQVLVHDLRSPLNVVGLNVSWVAEQLPGNLPEDVAADAADALDQVQVVTRRLSGMVNDLLNISKLEDNALPLAASPFELQQLLEGVARQFNRTVTEKGLSIGVDCGPGALVADKALLTRVLENLTSNALRYTPRGGRIRLHASRGDAGVVIAVQNDGEGISAAQRSQLFDKFQQLGSTDERRASGFGLGLYFCRLVAQAHRGVIAVEDMPGFATSMVMRLPAAKVLAAAA